ncbi:hypothetical protein BBOV_VI_pgp02 (apicoplast) [Babesia bovis T2Bo]|uniref:Ribosomal protein L4 n=1 Tax=Babesia bovis TaxID=5865 RepID=A7AXH1_BABBO|nr:hypothetical protein BBOV_VI_pgp02 [Babesia bovis T2Bo]EDO05094.1 hypothetical protein BBOV_V000440 [Babesia bovis T2Bo]|eukprot:YP_002290874.1 hypothetical protein BBOV_V000440 (apicoplast) [Babesia bovis T2Bo]
MNSLLLNINFYFNINLLKFSNYNIIIKNLYKYGKSYKHMLTYLKKILKTKIFNLKNKYNRTKSKNKYSKTYYPSSHNVKKGLAWVGLRNLKLNTYSKLCVKLLLPSLFNSRSNIIIHNLEYVKFLYCITSLNKHRYYKTILQNLKYYNYILNYNSNKQTITKSLQYNNINIIY